MILDDCLNYLLNKHVPIPLPLVTITGVAMNCLDIQSDSFFSSVVASTSLTFLYHGFHSLFRSRWNCTESKHGYEHGHEPLSNRDVQAKNPFRVTINSFPLVHRDMEHHNLE